MTAANPKQRHIHAADPAGFHGKFYSDSPAAGAAGADPSWAGGYGAALDTAGRQGVDEEANKK